jgi:hypothetical protein
MVIFHCKGNDDSNSNKEIQGIINGLIEVEIHLFVLFIYHQIGWEVGSDLPSDHHTPDLQIVKV